MSKQAARIAGGARAGSREQLLGLYAEADALGAGRACLCTDAATAPAAVCCHFGKIGREPYVSDLEMAEVARAVAGRGGLPRRRLPLAGAHRTCPLLSTEGRCSIYEARPLGCRTFFCEGVPGAGGARARRALLDVARRVSDASRQAFPRSEGPRPFTRALASLERPSRGRSAST